MSEVRYLVDTNAIVRITSARVRTKFFQENCWVTEDVLWELGEHPSRVVLEALVLERSAAMLVEMHRVMSGESPGNTSLIDLYRNKGAADPGLIATVLSEMTANANMLFADEWVIVTGDRAVLERAAQFGIMTISPARLSELIDLDS